uniref:Zf-CCHC domain-containing protein/DUF4219 domain-containing protein/UBN2 domain-containing protein n=1 Tax=Tanacetum cinerariifolium TaxID=118510 RepID=A0A6L2P608_TANCI|nr:zf-CCHC domain-containing protein/DUF4219 domain-containing protein/UBN2 domain-containing protein [Tanacetum cinerariifolium]
MTLYNSLPRKEYERVFMCKTAKEVWHTLIITHQGISQVKNCKINLLTHEYDKFSISNAETIDNGFTSDSQDGSDEDIDKEEEAEAFNLLAKNFCKFFQKRNSFGNKGGESSKPNGACYNCGIEGHFTSECRKPKENKAFTRGAWSDSEDGDEHQNDMTCLMAIDS